MRLLLELDYGVGGLHVACVGLLGGLLFLELVLFGHARGIGVVWVLVDVQGLRVRLSLAFGALLLGLNYGGGF